MFSGTEPAFVSTQIIDLKNSIALDLVFHQLISDQIVVAIGKDSGAVTLYYHGEEENSFVEFCNLRKHEDWVRCISFCQLGSKRSFERIKIMFFKFSLLLNIQWRYAILFR